MELSYLKDFCTLVDCGSYARAAKELFVAPSTLFNHIAILEKELGFPLFVRNEGALSLTRQGCVVLTFATRVCDEMTEMTRRCAELTSHVSTLRLQDSKSLNLGPLLFESAKRFEQKTGKRVDLRFVGNSERMPVELVDENVADLAFQFMYRDCGTSVEQLIGERPTMGRFVLATDELLLLPTARSPLHGLGSAPAERFEGTSIYFPTGRRSHQHIEMIIELFRRAGATVHPLFYQFDMLESSHPLESMENELTDDAIIATTWDSFNAATQHRLYPIKAEGINLTIEVHAVFDEAKLDEDQLAFVEHLRAEVAQSSG